MYREVAQDFPRGKSCLIVYNLPEIGFQGSAAYKASVDVGLCEQFCRVACVYGAAVLDADSFCRCFIIDLSDAVTDALADFLCLVGIKEDEAGS